MAWALLDANNKVLNVIAYDGVTPYVPPNGMTLAQIPDTHQIHDTVPEGDVDAFTPIEPTTEDESDAQS